MKVRHLAPAILAVLAACAKKEAATVGPAPIVIYSVPPEDVFVDLMVAAAGWAKGANSGRPLGVYQPLDADAPARRGVEAVTTRYGLRPINPSDFVVVCTSAGATVTARFGGCSMKYVDAVLAFNGIRMGRDSGYVGLELTRVPSGKNTAENVFYCVTLAKDDSRWQARRSRRVEDPGRCWRGAP
jgi:hypothetical protein